MVLMHNSKDNSSMILLVNNIVLFLVNIKKKSNKRIQIIRETISVINSVSLVPNLITRIKLQIKMLQKPL